MRQPLVSVIIPAFNEERRLPNTLARTIDFLKRQPYESELIVVTDGSRDRTAAVTRSAAQTYSSLKLIEFPFNRGKGFAVKAGMQAARGAFRLFMDADYAVPIDYIEGFLESCKNGHDVVIGSRAHGDTQIETRQGFVREKLAILFGYMQRSVLGIPFRDTQCGFKMFTAEAADKLFSRLTFDCAYFDAELLYIADRGGARVEERAVTWRHDQETRLPIGFKRTLDLLAKLASIRRIHSSLKPDLFLQEVPGKTATATVQSVSTETPRSSGEAATRVVVEPEFEFKV